MTAADADGVYRTSSEALPATSEERQRVIIRSAEEVERRKKRYRHFLGHDPEGAWVAVDGDRVTGVALAREGLYRLLHAPRGHAPLRPGRLRQARFQVVVSRRRFERERATRQES